MSRERATHAESPANHDRDSTESAESLADRAGRTFTSRDGRELTVRPVDPDTDREALSEMYAAFGRADQAQGVPPVDPGRLGRWLDSMLDGRAYVVCDSIDGEGRGDVIGHAVLLDAADPDADATKTPDGTAAASLRELAVFVAPAHRDAGVGTELLRSLLLDPAVGDVIRLCVRRDNRPAVALYRKFGFSVANRQRYELVMERRVA